MYTFDQYFCLENHENLDNKMKHFILFYLAMEVWL